MHLIVLHGYPGVGKLTVAQELNKISGYRLFHNHLAVDYAASVFNFGSVPFITLREKAWVDMFSAAVKNNVPGMIFTFAFENTVSESFFDSVASTVCGNGEHPGKLDFVHLTCDLEILRGRIEEPSRRVYGKLSSVIMFDTLLESGAIYQPQGISDTLTVDTTDTPPNEAAEKIAQSLAIRR